MKNNPRRTSPKVMRPDGFLGLEWLHASYTRQTFSRHFHKRYAVGVIEQGALGFRYMGRNEIAPTGSVSLVVPGEAHTGHPASEQGWTYRMFYLEPGLLEDAVSEGGQSKAPDFRAGVIFDPELSRLVRRAHVLMDAPDAGMLEKQTAFLSMLNFWVSRHSADPPRMTTPGSEHRAVRLAREFIEDNAHKDLKLKDLALEAGLSPFHLARTFKSSVGIPPHAYLIQARVRKAKALLTGLKSLAQIAAETGFADQSHLTREFRRQVGLTPGGFRKNLQNN